MTIDLDQALATFITESRDLLVAMEDGLLRLEQQPDDSESVNAVFRAAHTIKGSAGLFGLDEIVRFTHVVENTLDRVRDGRLAIGTDLIAVLLNSGDHIGSLVDHAAANGGRPVAGDVSAAGAALVEQLKRFTGETTAATPVRASSPVAGPAPSGDTCAVSSHLWHISLRFGLNALRNGLDPLSFLRYLATVGDLECVNTLYDSLPAGEEMDPESCYLGFEIEFNSEAAKQVIEEVFEFVRDDCRIRILPPHCNVSEYVALIKEAPAEERFLGDMLIASGALTRNELEEGLRIQRAEPATEARKLGEILVEQHLTQQPVVEAALEKQAQTRDAKVKERGVIRVQADKLDRLINLVGELVIAGAGANLLAQQSGLGSLQEATSAMGRLVEEIRDGALRLRMVEIGETFHRFNRVVRDVGRELGKEIDLVISGAETELDKGVVEKIGDPLMHLVRNAMDHGFEPSEVRAARGKPTRGRLSLNAFHESGSIVIEVSDDGGGLPRDKIQARARERGLIGATQELSDAEIYQLIFEPGFSTAEAVTNLSGRGVGMDVVRRNIEALQGTTEIESTEGVGTTVRVRLPLTLAIIEGFLVGVGKSAYVVPLDMVQECVELSSADHQAGYVNLRGEVLPLLRLRDQFAVGSSTVRRESVVVVACGGQKAGFAVDELLGEFQTVIKPLGRVFQNLRGVSGSTILGSGEVALILDVPGLIQTAAGREARA